MKTGRVNIKERMTKAREKGVNISGDSSSTPGVGPLPVPSGVGLDAIASPAVPSVTPIDTAVKFKKLASFLKNKV